MGSMRFNYRSEILGRYVDVSVVYPTDSYRCAPTARMTANRAHRAPGAEKPLYQPGMKFQTVYLIHGGGDDDGSGYHEAAPRAFSGLLGLVRQLLKVLFDLVLAPGGLAGLGLGDGAGAELLVQRFGELRVGLQQGGGHLKG